MKDKEKIFIILFEVASVVLAILIAMLFQWVIIPQWKKNQEKKEYFQLYQEIVQTFQAENAKIGECDVVLLGDSLTAGYPTDTFFKDSGYTVVNRGIGGDRVEWLNERLENSLAGLQPRLLVFLIAGNDVLAGESKEYILEAYNLLIDHAQTLCPNARILIESHYPLGGAWAEKGDTMYALNELEAEMAKAQGCFFLDVYSYLVKDGEMNMDYSVEGVHLNEKGYEIVTERLLNAFGEILS